MDFDTWKKICLSQANPVSQSVLNCEIVDDYARLTWGAAGLASHGMLDGVTTWDGFQRRVKELEDKVAERVKEGR